MASFVEVYLERPAFVMIWLRGRANPAIRALGRAHNWDVAAGLHDLARRLGVIRPDTPGVVAEGPTLVARYLELYARPARGEA